MHFMQNNDRAIILANFGGPRSLKEVEPFLIALFTDPEVFRVPAFLRPFFKRLAIKRSKKIVEDYEAIGGKSPIYDDTEFLAQALRQMQKDPVFTFHRYLPATHNAFFEQIEGSLSNHFIVFPMFPQFTYATTGSIATYFHEKLPKQIENRLRWVKSYPKHPTFVALFKKMITELLERHALKEEETILLFSAHGLPKSFIDEGDLYQEECLASFGAISKAFPKALSRISYQSKVGRAVWLSPATEEVCEDLESWKGDKKQLLFIPLSFTSDHIETLFEIEKEYMPLVREAGLEAYRLPAFNRRQEWIETILQIIEEETPVSNAMLTR